MDVPTYTVSMWPGSTATASAAAVVFDASPVLCHFEVPSHHQSRSSSSVERSPSMAR
jgi:hypothetical protein